MVGARPDDRAAGVPASQHDSLAQPAQAACTARSGTGTDTTGHAETRLPPQWLVLKQGRRRSSIIARGRFPEQSPSFHLICKLFLLVYRTQLSYFQRSLKPRSGHLVVVTQADMAPWGEGFAPPVPIGRRSLCKSGTPLSVQLQSVGYPFARRKRQTVVTDGRIRYTNLDNVYTLLYAKMKNT